MCLLTSISSSQFIHLHSLNYLSSEQDAQNNRTLFVADIDSTLYSFNINTLQSTPVQFPLSWFSTPVPAATIEVIGSCNGLLCLLSFCSFGNGIVSVNQVVLVNPFTRNFKEIPFHHLPVKEEYFNFGFGFADVNHVYKLVRVVECSDYGICVQVYNYNLKAYRYVDHVLPSRNHLESKSWAVLIGNHLLHWLLYNDNGVRIGCFDVRTDKWIEDVPLPESYNDGSLSYYQGYPALSLRKLEDGCLFFGDPRCSNSTFDLWIMKEYGVKESWFLYCISIVNISKYGFIDPLAHRKDEILLKPRIASNMVFVYNIGDKSITESELIGVAPFLQEYECKESLVAIAESLQIEAPKAMVLDDGTLDITPLFY